jgi:hypothetical protein
MTANAGAIMLILLLVMLLFYIGLTNTTLKQQSCSFEGFFTCRSYKVDSTFGLSLEVGQATGGAVLVSAVSCSASSSGIPEFRALENPVLLPHGDYRYIVGGGSGNAAYCGALQRGDSFRQQVCIIYSAVDFPVNHTVCGDLAVRVE